MTSQYEVRCKLLLLNGPPSSGKDTVARALKNYAVMRGLKARNIVLMKLADPIKNAYPSLLGKTNSAELDLLKDEEYLGVKRGIRKLQISLSEDCMKPLFGQDIFAKILTKRIACLHSDVLCVISDTGFTNEYKYLFHRTPRNNFLTLRLHRGNTTYEGDSREYVHGDVDIDLLPQYRIKDINNDFSITESIDGFIDLIGRELDIEYNIEKLNLDNVFEFHRLNQPRNFSDFPARNRSKG